MESINFFTEIKITSTILHVGAIVIGMGAALMGDVLFNFYSKDKKLNQTEIKTLNLLSKIVWIGLLLIALSGIMLFFSNPETYLSSDKFLAKMSILVVLIINGYFLSKKIWPRLARSNFLTDAHERTNRKTAFVCGAISIISWICVLILGILHTAPLPYARLMFIYGLILAVGIPIAIIIEKKAFN